MASISAPTLLATFQTSHASSSKDKHVTLAPVHGSRGELAVAAVQGDGIWTYDLKTLRPTTSYTVPPSTIFTTTPLSYVPPPQSSSPSRGKGKAPAPVEDAEMGSSVESDEEEQGPQRTTLVGVRSGRKGGKGKESGELWIWRGEDNEKKSLALDHDLQSLHHLFSSRYSVLAVTTDGGLLLLDSSDQLVPLQHGVNIPDVLTSKIISLSVDAFGLVIVSKDGRIRSLRIDFPEEGPSSAALTAESSLGGESHIFSSADVAESGIVTAINSSNHLFSRNIRQNTTDKQAFPLPKRPTPPALCCIPSPSPLILHTVIKPNISLLLSLAGSDRPIVLAATELSALSSDGNIPEISLIGQSSLTTHIVAFVVRHKHGDGDTGRSVIYTCELNVPAKGFGMNVLLGSSDMTERYLGTGETQDKPKENGDSGPSRPAKRDLDNLLEGNISGKDWKIIREIMRKSQTMPSATIVTVLKRAILDNHLEGIYLELLSLPPPAIDFRFELRKDISAEEAMHLLKQLVIWAEAWCNDRTRGLGWADVAGLDSPNTSLPTLDSILTHSSLLLDSHLPLLVEHDPAAPLLESLSASLAPLLALQAEIRQLRAPVNALLTLSKREEKRRAEAKAKKESMKQVITQTGGRKLNRPGMPKGENGGAMLPGEDFGKWRVEDFVF